MTFIDTENVIGSITPNVFISKITLTSNGNFEQVSDPHIDHEREPGFIKDPRTGKVVVEDKSPNFDEKSLSSKTLNITLNITLKESLNNAFIPSWFGNQDFSKYIKVKIIQTLKPFSFSLINTLKPNENLKFIDLSVQDLKQKSYEEVLSNGVKLINFHFDAHFQVKNVEPDYLAYLCFSYLDLPQLINDFGLQEDTLNLLDPIGKMVAEVVFQDGKLVDKTFVYFNEQGEVWAGPISQAENEFFGFQENGPNVKLTRQQTINAKIQDFRVFDVFQQMNIDLKLENEILDKLSTIKKDPFGKTGDKTYFTEFFISRDDQNRSRFLFGIDFRKLLKKNSIFGKLFDINDEIVKKSRIAGISIFRRRVRGSAELRTGAETNKKFLDDQFDELVLSSGETSFKTINVVNNSKASFHEIEQLAVPGQNLENVRFFSGIDKEVAEATDGYFIYRVDLSVIDPAFEFVDEKLRELKKIRNKLENYFTQGSFAGNVQTDLNLTDPHIKHEREVVVKGSSIPSNFDPIANRFTETFILEMKKRFDDEEMSLWGFVVSKYLEVLDLFVEDEVLHLKPKLLALIHPTTGSLSGIQKLIDLIASLERKLSNEVGLTYARSKFGEQATLSSVKSSTLVSNFHARTISISNVFFESVFNSSIGKGVGFDFLDVEEVDVLGLKTISGGKYRLRVDREIDKYFVRHNGINPDVNLQVRDEVFTSGDHVHGTSWSYLSPARISFSQNYSLNRLGHSPQPPTTANDLASAHLSIRGFNQGKNSFSKLLIGGVDRVVVKALDNTSFVSTTFQRNRVQPNIGIFSQERFPSVIDPVEDMVAECEANVYDANRLPAIPLLIQLLQENDFSLEFFDLNGSGIQKLTAKPGFLSANRIFQGKEHSTTLNDTLKAVPNQVKALFLSQTRPDLVRKNWFDRSNLTLSVVEQVEFQFDHQILSVVQVFRGFARDKEGDIFIKNSAWEPLTLDLFNRSVGTTLLCRLKPYENDIFGISPKKMAVLPSFDEFFLLIPEQVVDGVKQKEENPTLEKPRFRVEGLREKPPGEMNIYDLLLFNVKTDYVSTDTGISVGRSKNRLNLPGEEEIDVRTLI